MKHKLCENVKNFKSKLLVHLICSHKLAKFDHFILHQSSLLTFRISFVQNLEMIFSKLSPRMIIEDCIEMNKLILRNKWNEHIKIQLEKK